MNLQEYIEQSFRSSSFTESPIDGELYLFEALGNIVGTQTPVLQQQYISQLVTPLVVELSNVLTKQLYKQDTLDKAFYKNLVIRILSAVGNFSKGS